jgi:hypothetical protein
MVATSVQAGLIFDLQSFLGVTPTTSFVQGQTVTMRVIAIDTPGSPVLGTDNWQGGYNMRISASTADANESSDGTVLFPPAFVDGQFTGATGKGFGSIGAGASADGQTLLTFTYTADVLGDTVFDFHNSVVGMNAATFSSGTFNTSNGLQLQGQTVNVQAVPEPSSLALAGLVGVAAVLQRFRRRKKV